MLPCVKKMLVEQNLQKHMLFDIGKLDTLPVHGLGQRGIADLVEHEVSLAAKQHNFGDGWQYFEARSKRSPEDFSLKHKDGKVIYYDVKTHDMNGDFCMPNLISLDRARKIIKSDIELIYIFVKYKVSDESFLQIDSIDFIPLNKISFSCIEIQNLGLGVLQLKNAHKPIDFYSDTRHNWLVELNKRALAFYDKQIAKFEKLKDQYYDY